MSQKAPDNQSTDDKLNTAFIKTSYGILKVSQVVISLCAIISMSAGYCYFTVGKASYYNIVTVSSLILLIIYFILIIFRLDKFLIGRINLPLSFLISDLIYIVQYFIISILLMVAINDCYKGVTARIFASIFGILGLLGYVGSAVQNYNWFKSGNAPIPLSGVSGTAQTV